MLNENVHTYIPSNDVAACAEMAIATAIPPLDLILASKVLMQKVLPVPRDKVDKNELSKL